jgi:hypothetical protein
MTAASLQALVDVIVDHAGIMDQHTKGRITHHSFRRGSAQYRFCHAKTRLSLASIKWWYGWTKDEGVSDSRSL